MSKDHKSLTLQIQSFTIQESVFIISILRYKFNLKGSIHIQRSQPPIYLSSKSLKKLKPFILPYKCSSFK